MSSNSSEGIKTEELAESPPQPKELKYRNNPRNSSPYANNFNATIKEPHEEATANLIRHKLQESRVARRQAEEDKKRLINRIQLLKLEEQRVFYLFNIKAAKKFDQTRKKAKEIMHQRMKHAELQRQREEREIKRKEEIERRLRMNKEVREKMKESVQMQRINSINEKRNRSVMIKSQREEFKKIINMKKQEEQLKKYQKKEYARLQKLIYSQLKSKDQEGKKMNVLALTQQKLLYEDEEKLKVEADIVQLESEEYELIQKLQNTELLQHSGNTSLYTNS
jgi:hypothetical protein